MTATTLDDLYNEVAGVPSDISAHLGILRALAENVRFVTEFGVRTGVSTRALLAGHPTGMMSYDVYPFKDEERVAEVAKLAGVNWKFVQADTRKITITPTELLFIDTYHTYSQLLIELFMHGPKAWKYIAIHDTDLFGEHGENGQPGILKAIQEFLLVYPEWKLFHESKASCGLQVYAR